MLKNINKVVKMMILSDFFINGAFGSFAPIFAIFITNQIEGGSVKVVGLASATYWIVKSIIQLPIAKFLDKVDGEITQFWAVFWGYLLSGLVPIAYIFVSKPWHLYLTEAFLGICMAWAVPAWYSLFTRHVDKWRVSFEWSLESVFSVGLATSIATALGGYLADRYGFKSLFLGAGILSVLSTFLLLSLKKEFSHKKIGMPTEKVLPEKHHRRH